MCEIQPGSSQMASDCSLLPGVCLAAGTLAQEDHLEIGYQSDTSGGLSGEGAAEREELGPCH